jgi:hypothetical protein
MRNWMQLSDLALAERIDYEEKNGPENAAWLRDFAVARGHLSRLAWDAYADALNCDSGPIAATGVRIWPLDARLAADLADTFARSPTVPLRPDDFAFGYFASSSRAMCDHLNRANSYRAVGGEMTARLDELLHHTGAEIEQVIGHPFRVASTRAFDLLPNTDVGGRHLDGWPPSIRKLFVLPNGATARSGTTWFRGRNDKELVVHSEQPIMLLFENSLVWHAPQPSQERRPTIELDIVPAATTSLASFYAGLNGWYPWFPTRSLHLQGTRMAANLSLGREPDGFWRRLIRR